jgi:ATP-dependent RNA helicase RhlB
MLFSATLNAWVKNLAWEYTISPLEIEITPEVVTVEEIDQILYHVPSEDKMKLLLGVFDRERPESAIIFCNTKRYTEIVAKRLRLNGYECEFIIGDLPQSRRQRVIDDVKAGKIQFLAATDVAARGLDIDDLAMVVNYDLPTEAENYVHRIGRTARAGKTGRAVSLVTEQDVYELPAIERYIGKKVPSEIAIPEFYAEDKSAGLHIQTEFYEDRREERRPSRSFAKPKPKPAHKTGHGRTSPAEGERPRAAGHVPGRVHPSVAGHTHAGKKGEKPRHGQRKDSLPLVDALISGEKDLSRMTFEERMDLYKMKYHSGGSGGRQDRRRKEKKEKNDIPEKLAEILQEQREHNAPEPKGLFSRLLGIFKK